jgi:hypothetical protein
MKLSGSLTRHSDSEVIYGRANSFGSKEAASGTRPTVA